MISDGAFTWAVGASVGAHVLGLVAAPLLGLAPVPAAAPARPPVAIEIVTPPAPAAPVPPPPRKAERLVPPRPLRQPVVERPAPAPIQPSTLLEDPKVLDAPAPALVQPDQKFLPGNALTTQPEAKVAGPREGGAAGAGALFDSGDLPVRGGPGSAAGSGASGTAGTGLASVGSGDAVAAVGPAGITAFARPLGGYQTLPVYPESARRAHVEGTSLLRFVVQADGRVGDVKVERSAGHADLDRAAIEAVKTWRFDPARRGKEPVPVWVTLPVRFSLTSR